MKAPLMTLSAVTIDCSDSGRLADFYAQLTGGDVTYRDDESGHAQTTLPGGTLNFQRVESYTQPRWPSQAHPQQFHLDFQVDDVNAAVARAKELGGAEATEQPAVEYFTVMMDPDGHPFCLCPSTS